MSSWSSGFVWGYLFKVNMANVRVDWFGKKNVYGTWLKIMRVFLDVIHGQCYNKVNKDEWLAKQHNWAKIDGRIDLKE